MACVHNWVYLGDSISTSHGLFVINAERSRLWHVRDESPGYPWIGSHALAAPLLDLVFGEDQQQVLCNPYFTDLGPPTSHRTRSYSWKFEPLGEIRPEHPDGRVSIHLCNHWYVFDTFCQKLALTFFSRLGQP